MVDIWFNVRHYYGKVKKKSQKRRVEGMLRLLLLGWFGTQGVHGDGRYLLGLGVY
jgi:hypothetical protein